jgi:aspartate 1-decarboxylase
MRTMLKSKIHKVRVTDVNVSYEGSITIDKRLMEAADIVPYEQVHVLDINNGARFETYAITGDEGSGQICVNGAAARLVAKGDTVIILTYCHIAEGAAQGYEPRLVYVDSQNRSVRRKTAKEVGEDLVTSLERGTLSEDE